MTRAVRQSLLPACPQATRGTANASNRPTSRLARPTSRLARRDARDCGALRCALRGVARASARLRVRLFSGRVSGIDQRLARLFCGRVSVIEPRLARFFIKKQTTHKNASHPIRNIRVHTYLLQTLINMPPRRQHKIAKWGASQGCRRCRRGRALSQKGPRFQIGFRHLKYLAVRRSDCKPVSCWETVEKNKSKKDGC